MSHIYLFLSYSCARTCCSPNTFFSFRTIREQEVKSTFTVTVQFSYSVMSNTLRLHESQHASPPCPSPTPGVHSDSRPSSQWCHPAISSSVVPFSSCPQSLLASESFPMSQLFAWGGQSTGVSALASFLPKNIQDWSPSEWTGWISSQSQWKSIFASHILAFYLSKQSTWTTTTSVGKKNVPCQGSRLRWSYWGKAVKLKGTSWNLFRISVF